MSTASVTAPTCWVTVGRWVARDAQAAAPAAGLPLKASQNLADLKPRTRREDAAQTSRRARRLIQRMLLFALTRPTLTELLAASGRRHTVIGAGLSGPPTWRENQRWLTSHPAGDRECRYLARGSTLRHRSKSA
jgi:hypothetical protein